jgi:hypothetical protein
MYVDDQICMKYNFGSLIWQVEIEPIILTTHYIAQTVHKSLGQYNKLTS